MGYGSVFVAILALALAGGSWAAESVFPLGPQGDVAHWLYSGRRVRVLGPGEGRDLRKLLASGTASFSIEALSARELAVLSDGTRPRAVFLNDGPCCSDYQFYRELSFVEAYLLADLVVGQAVTVQGTLWMDRGGAEVHVDGRKVLARVSQANLVEGVPLTCDLSPGRHRVIIRRTALGERNVPFQTGLRLVAPGSDVAVALPIPDADLQQALAMDNWLQGVRSDGSGTLTAPTVPAFPVQIIAADHILPWRPTLESARRPWPEGKRSVRLDQLGTGILGLWVEVGEPGSGIRRAFDWPYLAPLPRAEGADLGAHRKRLLANEQGINWTLFAGLRILRWLDDGVPATDPRIEAEVDRAAATIANRDGTSDFQMSAVVRLLYAAQDRLTDRQRQVLRRTLLDGTYWTDEGDAATMTFTSENHRVMLHAASRLVAGLYPEGTFLRSGRRAAEQASVAGQRLAEWFAVRERSGMMEFLSPAYNNETFLALVNLYDHDRDAVIRERARGVMDQILRFAALHSFRGYGLGPNGRCYRQELLAPQLEGRSAILSWFSSAAVQASNSITAALAHSSYPGLPMAALLHDPVERRDVMGGTEVYLRRTADYMIATCTNPTQVVQEQTNPFSFLSPGQSMYQHHLWEIALGGHARVFTQSPATANEILDARPGYWVGEQATPTIAAVDGRVQAIYRLKPGSMMTFTHAWWPSAAFDAEVLTEHWAFARKGAGYAALWCSLPMLKHANVAQGCELRALGREAAWIGIAASTAESGSFAEFQQKCMAIAPGYDATTGVLLVDGKPSLVYGQGVAAAPAPHP